MAETGAFAPKAALRADRRQKPLDAKTVEMLRARMLDPWGKLKISKD